MPVAGAAHAAPPAQPQRCTETGQRRGTARGAGCPQKEWALRAELQILQQSQAALEEARAAARCALQARIVLKEAQSFVEALNMHRTLAVKRECHMPFM